MYCSGLRAGLTASTKAPSSLQTMQQPEGYFSNLRQILPLCRKPFCSSPCLQVQAKSLQGCVRPTLAGLLLSTSTASPFPLPLSSLYSSPNDLLDVSCMSQAHFFRHFVLAVPSILSLPHLLQVITHVTFSAKPPDHSLPDAPSTLNYHHTLTYTTI